MPDDIRVGSVPRAPRSETAAYGSGGGDNHRRSSSSKLPWVLLALVIILGVLGFMFRDRLMTLVGKDSETGTEASEYQAVFLTNGQVYFGKIQGMTDNFVKLANIYYLQVTEAGLQGSQQSGTQNTNQQRLQLVKLGDELHGPVDEMLINRDHILFYEDMKTNAQVVEAIERAAKEGGNGNPTPTP